MHARARTARLLAVGVATALLACGGASATAPGPPAPAPADESQSKPLIVLERHDVEADGHPLAVWSKTPTEPKGAFVLVHGRTWSALPDFDLQVPGETRSLMDALVTRGWAAYAVDLRGYGGTPRDSTGWVTPDRAARDLAAVVAWAKRRSGATAPVLLGWSMGSLVAQLCAQRHPASVRSLVLFGYPRPAEWSVPVSDDPKAPPREPTTRTAAAEDFITRGTISQTAVDAYVDAAVAADPVRADWARIHEFNELDAAKITVPTLVIHGDRDPYAPVTEQSALVDRVVAKRKRLVTLEGLDHAAHLEDLARFVEAVLEFVEGS